MEYSITQNRYLVMFMKYILLVVIILSLSWETFYMPTSDPVLWIYKTMLGTTMWGLGIMYLFDFSMAMFGRNSGFMIEFYSELAPELKNCASMGCVLVVLSFLAKEKYNFLSPDIALLGAPFLLQALSQVKKCTQLNVAGATLPRKATWAMTFIFSTIFILSIYVVWKIQYATLPAHQSVWFQVSIFFTSLASYIMTNQLRFFLENKKIEPSPVLMQLFRSFKGGEVYGVATTVAGEWNKEAKRRASEQRLMKRRKNKKKR
jgi:hypothetical protein